MDQKAGDWKTSLAAVQLSQYSLSWDTVIVGVVTLVVVVVIYGSWRNKSPANLPPGPRNWPVIGALFQMEPFLHKTMDKFAKLYGPIVLFRLGVQTLVVVSSAESAEELLKHKDADFCDRATAMTRSSSKYTGFDGAIFVFANYDADLKLHKKLAITEFFTTAKIKSYEMLRTQEVAVMVEKIFDAIKSSNRKKDGQDNFDGSGVPMGIRSISVGVIRNIMFSLCFGKRFDGMPPQDELTEFPDILETLMELVMSVNLVWEITRARFANTPVCRTLFDLAAQVDYFPWLTWLDPQGLLKRMKTFDKRHRRFYEGILERNRRSMKQKRGSAVLEGTDDESSTRNFVDVLLRAQEDGNKISDKGVIGTIMSMLSAGIDTTGSQIEWVLLELARQPKLLQRLQCELDSIVGKDRPLEENDLALMPFLSAVVLETLRLHPAVPFSFPHVNLAPSTLGGFTIPAKTAVILNIYSIGRDAKAWKDPLQFNPDRFMESGSSLSPDSIKPNGNYFKLLPFSSGRRVCSGYNLAILLLLRTVGSLVHAFDWAPPPGCTPEDLSIEEVEPFIIHPNPDLYLVPTPRLSPHVYMSNLTVT